MSPTIRQSPRTALPLVLATCLAWLGAAGISSGEPDAAVAAARKQAKEALKLAITKLQETAGPDQRVTARADILDPAIRRPHLTGVWNSWEIKATEPPQHHEYERDSKAAKFLSWLVSSPVAAAANQMDFAYSPAVSPVTLLGAGTLGNEVAADRFVTASKVPVASPPGAYAWVVLDEGVKARINTSFYKSASPTGSRTQQLGSGVRPGTEFIPGLSGLGRDSFEESSVDFENLVEGIGNANFLPTAEQIAPGSAAALKSLTHDVTLHSLGLFTDTACGGLKQDFHLLTNSVALPSAYSGRGVYNTRLGLSIPSDPEWGSFQQFARIYNDSVRLASSGGVPVLRAQGPSGWRAAGGSNPNTAVPGVPQLAPPPGAVLMPTVAKVQMVFSLATRDIYNYPKVSDTTPKTPGTKAQEEAASLYSPWGRYFAGSSYDYTLHLIYTPVVTIHNPYNVALEFNELKVVFGNVPFALQVFRNGVPQTNGLAPLDTMYFSQSETGSLSKRFGMTLRTQDASGTLGSTIFRLLPGEVMSFSPYIDTNRTWKDELTAPRTFFDWDGGTATRTLTIDGVPGWRGDGIGYDLDWFCPTYNNLRVSAFEVENGVSMSRLGVIGARANDEFSVKFAPLSVPNLSQNKFKVEIFARPPGSASPVSSGMIELDYETPTGLQNSLLGPNGTLTYPATGTINTMEMHSHSLTKIKDISTAKPFAVVSMQAKTTLGGQNPAGEDGKLATKPWSFAHAPIGASTQKAVTGHPANHSHEFSIGRLDNGTSFLIETALQGRGNFITGHTSSNGLKFGALYDIPLAPIQTFASLNGANPGGSSGYLPRFAQPIGNSWAHPLMNPAKISEPGVEGYSYADHSFLLNLALYDGFYFSGLADQTGPFGTGSTSSTLATTFAAGTPLDDPRLILYRPDSQVASSFPGEAAKSSAYSDIGAWQLMAGAFNINSTSVPAWKAVLASIHDSQALVNQINKTAKTSSLTALPTHSGEARISRFRLPASTSATDGALPSDGYWLGPREFSDAELQTLAENIVAQVRLRGPFLSMAEFVNRRLGPESDAMAQRGALQQAIDNSDLNSSLADVANAGFEIPAATVSSYNYKNPTAGIGPSFQGAPGDLNQADILNILGNAATARSDTFVVRSYGEAHGANGETTATAVCEAVVQRLPDWVDPADKAKTRPVSLESPMNKALGRGFRLISFRWLNDDEI